ncbi:hypothetical protein VTI74DRAFT_6016 [Chaetomium olivicolor]
MAIGCFCIVSAVAVQNGEWVLAKAHAQYTCTFTFAWNGRRSDVSGRRRGLDHRNHGRGEREGRPRVTGPVSRHRGPTVWSRTMASLDGKHIGTYRATTEGPKCTLRCNPYRRRRYPSEHVARLLLWNKARILTSRQGLRFRHAVGRHGRVLRFPQCSAILTRPALCRPKN